MPTRSPETTRPESVKNSPAGLRGVMDAKIPCSPGFCLLQQQQHQLIIRRGWLLRGFLRGDNPVYCCVWFFFFFWERFYFYFVLFLCPDCLNVQRSTYTVTACQFQRRQFQRCCSGFRDEVTTVSVSVSVSSARPEDSTLDVLMSVCFRLCTPGCVPTFLLPYPFHPCCPPSVLVPLWRSNQAVSG